MSLQQLTAIVSQQQSNTNVKCDRFTAVAWGPESCCAIVQHQVSCMLLPGKELESKTDIKIPSRGRPPYYSLEVEIHEAVVLLPFSYHLFSEMRETKRKQNTTLPSFGSLKDSGIDTKTLAMHRKLRPTKAASLIDPFLNQGRTSVQNFNISLLHLLVPKLLKYRLFGVFLQGFSSLT